MRCVGVSPGYRYPVYTAVAVYRRPCIPVIPYTATSPRSIFFLNKFNFLDRLLSVVSAVPTVELFLFNKNFLVIILLKLSKELEKFHVAF